MISAVNCPGNRVRYSLVRPPGRSSWSSRRSLLIHLLRVTGRSASVTLRRLIGRGFSKGEHLCDELSFS